jgi:hypothetical protein
VRGANFVSTLTSLRPRIQLADGETLIHQGPANVFIIARAGGGWLFLANARLVFASHSLNLFDHSWEASLGDIDASQGKAFAECIRLPDHFEKEAS